MTQALSRSLSAGTGTDRPPRSRRRLAGLLVGGALLGKLLGLLREVTLARVLGATFVVDGFRGALTAVLLPVAPLGGDVIPGILIPLQRAWRAQGVGPRHAMSLCAVFMLAASLVGGLVWVFADAWVSLLVGGFSAEGHTLTVRFVRVMAFAMPAASLFNCLSSIEIAIGRSRLTSVRSSTQNVAVIAGVVIAAITGMPLAIAWCYTIGFDAVVLGAVVMLWREGELDPAGLAPSAVLHVLSVFLRRLRHLVAQPIADQAVVWIERFLGSASGVGTVAALDYARSLSETVTLLVSQPVGYVVLSQGETGPGDTARRIGAIARPVLALGLPLSTFLILFAPDIVHLTFGRGAFTPHAELLTSRTLQGIAVGLWASVLGWIIVRMLNVAGRNSRAAAIFVAAYATNAAILLGVVPWLTAPGLPSLGLGLAESARGLVLLFGTALALGYARRLLVLIMWVLPGCAVLALIGAFVLTSMDAGFARLAVGGAALCLVCLTTFIALMPREAIALARLPLGPVRRARRRKDLAAKAVG